MRWLIKRYLADNHIDSISQLSKMTGINLRTLMRRLDNPETLLMYEFRSLDEVLHFTEEDKLKIISGDIS